MPLTYSKYLKLDQLLNLQEGKSKGPEHDEMLFIVIHQTFELWFMQILHELDHTKNLFAKNDLNNLSHSMRRVLTILKVLVHQIDILETMTPLQFLSFRNYLESASGFQSYQFRELEFMLGFKNINNIKMFAAGSVEREKLEKRFKEMSLWDYFIVHLNKQGYEIPSYYLNRDFTSPVEPNNEIQAILHKIYKSDPKISQFCEMLVDLDEGIQEWRYRHVKMVERTIGYKKGTGQSAGVEYLKKTLFKPLFPDLWEVRTSFEYEL